MSFSAKWWELYEKQYVDILDIIFEDGYKELNQRTNVETLRLPHATISVNLQKEFPILKCKQVFWKSARDEIMWIMQQQSNNIHDLGSHIWDAWANEHGSIGKAYGYQVAKPVTMNGITYENQVQYVLQRLSEDSSDRRAVIDLWNVDDLGEMNLAPCCFSSIWTVVNGYLNCMLIQRSADFLVGVPFNTTQYAILTHLFARHLGLKVGLLTHVMTDVHIYCYESHLNGGRRMLDNFSKIETMKLKRESIVDEFKHAIITDSNIKDELKSQLELTKSQPKIVFNTPETDFFKISKDDISIEDYKYIEKIKFDVAT